MNKPPHLLILLFSVLILSCSSVEDMDENCGQAPGTGDVEIYASIDRENISVWIRSNLEENLPGTLSTRTINFDGNEKDGPEKAVSVIASDSTGYFNLAISDLEVSNPASTLLQVSFESDDGSQRATDLVYFMSSNDLELQVSPDIETDVQPILTGYKVRLRSEVLVKNVRLSFPGVEGTWSADCFDLLPGRLGEYYFSVTEYTPGLEGKLLIEYLN